MNKRFLYLRDLAYTLDLRLGLETRKIILEDNQKLTLKTDEEAWVKWLSQVLRRAGDSIDDKTMILIKGLLDIPRTL